MSTEDLKETRSESQVKIMESSSNRSQSGRDPKGVRMKENNTDVSRKKSDTSQPLSTATDPEKSPSQSYSYLNNPKVNFGSEVPFTLKSDTTRLNEPPPTTVPPPNRDASIAMMERIAFPYKLLKKYISSLPDNFYTNSPSEPKRDVGTLVQSMSLFMNGRSSSEVNTKTPRNSQNFSSGVEPCKPNPGQQHHPVSEGRTNPADYVVRTRRTPPLLVEFLYPQVLANDREHHEDTKERKRREKNSPPVKKRAKDPAYKSPSHGGSYLSTSSKSTNLFEAISKTVMSITSPGHSIYSNSSLLPRFPKQNTGSQIFTDRMLLAGHRISDTSLYQSCNLSGEETLTPEELQNDEGVNIFELISELSSSATPTGGESSSHIGSSNIIKSVSKEFVLGKDSTSTTAMAVPNQLSLHNLFDERYLSGKKCHSVSSIKQIMSHVTSDEDGTIAFRKISNESAEEYVTDNSEWVTDSSSVEELSSLPSSHGLLEDKNVRKCETEAEPLVPSRIHFDDSTQDTTIKSAQVSEVNNQTVRELRSLISTQILLDNKDVIGKDETKVQPLQASRINFDDSIQHTMIAFGMELQETSEGVKELRTLMSIHSLMESNTAIGEDKRKLYPLVPSRINFDDSLQLLTPVISVHNVLVGQVYVKETLQPVEANKKDVEPRDSVPTIILYRDEPFFRPYENIQKRTEEIRNESGNAFDVFIKQVDDTITIQITDQSPCEGSIPLKIFLDKGRKDEIRPTKTQPEEKAGTTETYLSANSSCTSLGSDEDVSSSNQFKDATDCSKQNYEKKWCDKRKSLRDLHSLCNTEYLPNYKSDGTRWRKLPLVLYKSTSDSNDNTYETPAYSIDGSEVTFKHSTSQVLRLSTPKTASLPEEVPNMGTGTSASLESSEEATPEESIDEVSASDSDDSTTESSTHSNWSTIPSIESPADEDEKNSHDDFDSSFKFSQLEFPTSTSVSEGSESPEVSLQSSASEATDQSGSDGTGSADDASLLKYLTTGLIKSSDTDEKLSEAHGNSKPVFKEYKSSNEENLDVGTKASGSLPGPQEMLSIYSRGEEDEPSKNVVTAKSSPSLSIKIKPAIRKNEESTSTSSAKKTHNTHVGRSVSFNKERREFPWRESDSLVTPVAVTPAHVQTTSPMSSSSQGNQDLAEESPSSAKSPKENPQKHVKFDSTGSAKNQEQAENDKKTTREETPPDSATKGSDGSGKRGDGADENQAGSFMETILPYVRLFFMPVMDEVVLDTFHMLRGGEGCELCSVRRQEQEDQIILIPRDVSREGGDQERQTEQEKEESDRRDTNNNEEDGKEDEGEEENEKEVVEEKREEENSRKQDGKEEEEKPEDDEEQLNEK